MSRFQLHPMLTAALLLTLSAACDESSPLSPEQRALNELSRAVEPLRELEAARAAGYEVLVVHPTNGNECLRDPELGAMGFHYLNPALVDADVAVEQPEVLIYERQQDGSFRFVAVEYVIPFDLRARTEAPPVLFGREFKQNETFGLWALHAWVGTDNPRGTFADWNPAVSCE